MIKQARIRVVLVLRPSRFVAACARLRFRHCGGFDRRQQRPISRSLGFTLLELVLAVAIFSLTTMIALPLYTQQVDKAKVARATGDIGRMQIIIQRYDLRERKVPLTLAEAGITNINDPWGEPYQYLSLQNCNNGGRCTNPDNGRALARRDGSLKPINSFFDLYSMGKDGMSRRKLTASESQDDVVRALDGAYIGLASKYSPR